MPTVEIKQETLDFLQELIKEINSQDRRCTASPYYYVLEREIWVQDQINGQARYYDCDGAGGFKEEIINDWMQDGYTKEEAEQGIEDQYTEVYEALEWVRVEGPIFLTEKAIDEHLRLNRHHYIGNVRNYIDYFWRNYEMEDIFKAIADVAGVEIEGLK